MKITLINGSPKVKGSASGLILNELKIFLNNSEDEAERNISISEYNFRKFYEGEQNKLAIEIIENWSENVNLNGDRGLVLVLVHFYTQLKMFQKAMDLRKI